MHFCRVHRQKETLTDYLTLILIRNLNFLKEAIKDYTLFRGTTWEVYRDDRSKRRDVERWTENLVTSSIDISKQKRGNEIVKEPKKFIHRG